MSIKFISINMITSEEMEIWNIGFIDESVLFCFFVRNFFWISSKLLSLFPISKVSNDKNLLVKLKSSDAEKEIISISFNEW